MIDLSGQELTRAGIYRAGVPVIFQRLVGAAPDIVITAASVTAMVRMATSDTEQESQTNYPASKPGAITQDDRVLLVMADDLAKAGFPLPVAKNDRVVLDPATAETSVVTNADRFKRQLVGAIEVTVAGVT